MSDLFYLPNLHNSSELLTQTYARAGDFGGLAEVHQLCKNAVYRTDVSWFSETVARAALSVGRVDTLEWLRDEVRPGPDALRAKKYLGVRRAVKRGHTRALAIAIQSFGLGSADLCCIARMLRAEKFPVPECLLVPHTAPKNAYSE